MYKVTFLVSEYQFCPMFTKNKNLVPEKPNLFDIYKWAKLWYSETTDKK